MKTEGFEKAENFERFNEASFIVNNRRFVSTIKFRWQKTYKTESTEDAVISLFSRLKENHDIL